MNAPIKAINGHAKLSVETLIIPLLKLTASSIITFKSKYNQSGCVPFHLDETLGRFFLSHCNSVSVISGLLYRVGDFTYGN